MAWLIASMSADAMLRSFCVCVTLCLVVSVYTYNNIHHLHQHRLGALQSTAFYHTTAVRHSSFSCSILWLRVLLSHFPVRTHIIARWNR